MLEKERMADQIVQSLVFQLKSKDATYLLERYHFKPKEADQHDDQQVDDQQVDDDRPIVEKVEKVEKVENVQQTMKIIPPTVLFTNDHEKPWILLDGSCLRQWGFTPSLLASFFKLRQFYRFMLLDSLQPGVLFARSCPELAALFQQVYPDMTTTEFSPACLIPSMPHCRRFTVHAAPVGTTVSLIEVVCDGDGMGVVKLLEHEHYYFLPEFSITQIQTGGSLLTRHVLRIGPEVTNFQIKHVVLDLLTSDSRNMFVSHDTSFCKHLPNQTIPLAEPAKSPEILLPLLFGLLDQ